MDEFENSLIEQYATNFSRVKLQNSVFTCCEAYGFLQAINIFYPNRFWVCEAMKIVLDETKKHFDKMEEAGILAD